MRKYMTMLVVVALTLGVHAHGCPPGPGWGNCHGCGGYSALVGFAGGMVGGLVVSAISSLASREPAVVQSAPTVVTQPVVVQQPVVIQQPVVVQQSVAQSVWVSGKYVSQIQSNGSVVLVWQPGHYELR